MPDRFRDDDRPPQDRVDPGRHYGEGGRWQGGAPWGGRGGEEERYPLPRPEQPRATDRSWRPDPEPRWRAEPAAEWREQRHPPHREQVRSYDDRFHDHDAGRQHDDDHDRRWWNRAADEVRAWSGDDRAIQRRRVETGRWRDGDRDDAGYRRSDIQLADAVAEVLGRDRKLDASHIDIAVYKGEVALNGRVRTREGRRRAEILVEALPGVRDVDNHLRVERFR